jgi:hypothetical protein
MALSFGYGRMPRKKKPTPLSLIGDRSSGGHLETAQQIEQRAFARTRGSLDADKLAPMHTQGHLTHCLHHPLAILIEQARLTRLDQHRLVHHWGEYLCVTITQQGG